MNTPPPPEDRLRLAGTTIGAKYRVEGVIGEGGAGIVYRGTNVMLGERVAIKFIKPEDDAKGPKSSFLKEAKLLFGLAHPNIVRMYDVGELEHPRGRLYYVVLELLDGVPLDVEIRSRAEAKRPFTVSEISEWFGSVLGALAFAHDQGIIHRDLKPSNVMLGRSATGITAKILDFGTARATDQVTRMTTHFTPRYASPEQWDPSRGARGPWTDVYALGLILYEMVTLELAVPGNDLPTILSATLRPERPTFAGKKVPCLFLESVLAGAVALPCENRFANARLMHQAFRAALDQAGSKNFEGTSLIPSRSGGSGGPSGGGMKETLAIPSMRAERPSRLPPPMAGTLPLGAHNARGTHAMASVTPRPGTMQSVPHAGASNPPAKSRRWLVVGAAGVLLVFVSMVIGGFIRWRRVRHAK